MPTSKPRITITLEPRSHEVLSRLSAAGGESMSALVSQFVDAALPSLERLVVVLERAQAAPKEAVAGLVAAVERAERHVMPLLTSAQGMGDLFLEDMADAVAPSARPPATDAKRPRQGAGKKAAKGSKGDPLLVTRGSGRPSKVVKGVPRG